MIKGYKQTKGLDYFDTYSPVTRINSIRMVLTIAALRNLEVHHMDVKTTFQEKFSLQNKSSSCLPNFPEKILFFFECLFSRPTTSFPTTDLIGCFPFFFPPPLAICFKLLIESTTRNEKTREEEENYKDTGKKIIMLDRVLCSTISLKQIRLLPWVLERST